MDAIVADGQPYVIDVNARLVEPGNAMASGTDMVGAMLDVALGRFVNPAAHSKTGVRTHQLLMAILGQAQLTGRRRAVCREVFRAATRRGVYAGSTEELCPMKGDWRTVLLPVAALVATLDSSRLVAAVHRRCGVPLCHFASGVANLAVHARTQRSSRLNPV